MTGRAGIVGGAAVPHAPQFFTLPPTEDHDQVARCQELMGRIGDGLKALGPDLVIVVANDHLENFMFHAVPSFTLHCGAEAAGSFGGRDFAWPVPSAAAADLLHRLQDTGFDPAFTMNATIGYEFGIPLTFLGMGQDVPVLPIYVNSYVPPQPRADRCYAFGQALARAVDAAGVRAVIVASGGLSHYPGTDLYSHPDVEHDALLMERIERGNLRSLLVHDDAGLDRTGNVEARSWLILAGALGERVPDVTGIEPSWHHVYAMAGWTSGEAPPTAELHYPMTDARLLPLYEALYDLRMHPAAREAWMADPEAYASRWALTPEQHTALVALDEPTIRSFGVHPMLGFLARLEVDLLKRQRAAT